MPDTPDPAASALDRISAELRTFGASDEDTRRLLKAVEAALKAADRWATEAARLDKVAKAEADPQSRIAISLRAQALEDCTRDVRAITAAP